MLDVALLRIGEGLTVEAVGQEAAEVGVGGRAVLGVVLEVAAEQTIADVGDGRRRCVDFVDVAGGNRIGYVEIAGEQAGLARADIFGLLPDHARQMTFAGPALPVILNRFEAVLRANLPVVNREGAAACFVIDQIGRAVVAIDFVGFGDCHADNRLLQESQQAIKRAVGRLERHDDGRIVCGDDPALIEEARQQAGTLLLGAQRALVRIDHVSGGQRRAVVEFGLIGDFERPHAGVVGGAPRSAPAPARPAAASRLRSGTGGRKSGA